MTVIGQGSKGSMGIHRKYLLPELPWRLGLLSQKSVSTATKNCLSGLCSVSECYRWADAAELSLYDTNRHNDLGSVNMAVGNKGVVA